jgi:Zn-dependent protease
VTAAPSSGVSERPRPKWSWTIGKFAGIEVRVHATFLLLLAWIAVTSYQRAGTLAGTAEGVVFILAVFLSVVVHEYGHALTAARFGVKTRGITLLPIGGVAQLERMPERPQQELLIAAAGPAVTVAIVAVLYVVLRALGSPVAPEQALRDTDGPFIARLMWINITLAVFNLIPAFPMDGGRILRAAIAMRTDYARATEIAARNGQAFALVFGIVGLFIVANPFLVLIAFFVWIAAAGEAAISRLRKAVQGLPVSRVMITDVRTLAVHEPLARAVEHVMAGFQHDFPVMDGGTVVGILTRTDLLRALAEGKQAGTVEDVMQRSFVSSTPNETLDAALARLQECRCQTLPVLRDGALAGVLTMETIGEFVAVQSAYRSARRNTEG